MNTGLILSLIGTGFLFLTSFVHIAKGYPRLSSAINSRIIDLPSFSPKTREIMSPEELRVMWLSFGLHILFLSAIISYLCLINKEPVKIIIILLSCMPIIDAILLKIFIKGIHLGSPLLALSGALIIVGQFFT